MKTMVDEYNTIQSPDTLFSKIMKNRKSIIVIGWSIISWHWTILSADFILAIVHKNITTF